MCGIAGIVAPQASRHRIALDAMVASLVHRGPDGLGTHYFEDCALGFTRLSIVDLVGGHQPMLSPGGRVGLTCNGEIYGYKDIRAQNPYEYKTQSDVEVILSLYDRYGLNMMEHVPGMFAFALWDDKDKTLVCARDRFGEKPFYYATGRNGEFVFGSEIKSILASGLVDNTLNREALAHYLQKLYVYPSQSIYKDIHSLRPGHFLVLRDGKVQTMPYWKLPRAMDTLSLEDAVEKFGWLLDAAVKKQLVADVPVGAFLSGGLDSSTVVALASRHAKGLKTFSYGFEGDRSELPFAREVARIYDTEHIELFDDEETRLADLIVEMQNVYDEPFADSSNIPTYLLSRLARRHIKVVLGGDGGDELLAGYAYWYRTLFDMQSAMERQLSRSALTRELFFLSYRVMRRLNIPLSKEQRERAEGVRLIKNLTTFAHIHRWQNEYFKDPELRKMGVTPWRPNVIESETNSIDDAFRMDIQDYMPGDILVKTDRASMAHGLELRAPLLDADFAEFCISLPYQMKINTTTDKRILREAFAEKWPQSIRSRGKQGFGAPVKQWLARPAMRALKEEYLLDRTKRVFSVLDHDAVMRYVSVDDDRTWILLVLSVWMETRRPVVVEQ